MAAAYRRYTVGAYYFSGWSHGPNNNISTLLTQSYRGAEPLIGWYDDTQRQLDRSIAQAADAGITFFAFDWYDTVLSASPTDRTLNEGLHYYLHSARRNRLKFCLVYIDQAPFIPSGGTLSAAHWDGLISTWIAYFKRPEYQRVNGKPLFILFSPEHLRDVLGGSGGVRRALARLRARVVAAGLPGVTVAVAATVVQRGNPARVAQLNAEGYDAATGYNYHSLGGEKYRHAAPYGNLVRENVATWNQVASRVHVPYIPVVTSGWDQRYSSREQATAIIYGGRSPHNVACFALQARHWIDTHATQTTRERVVMLFAWNEIGEGGALIPTRQDGKAYADAVHRIFGAAGAAPGMPARPCA